MDIKHNGRFEYTSYMYSALVNKGNVSASAPSAVAARTSELYPASNGSLGRGVSQPILVGNGGTAGASHVHTIPLNVGAYTCVYILVLVPTLYAITMYY